MMAFTDTIDNNIRLIALDRAPLNLLDLDAIKALSQAFKSHDSAMSLVLTGANSIFSAGVDTKAFASYSSDERVQLAREITQMTARLLSISAPVVAAIPGHAMGGGFVLPLCADYRFVAERPDSKFALSEAAAGVPFPSGPMEIIRHEVPMPMLRRMTLTSERQSLQELVEAGVFDEMCAPNELLERAMRKAEALGRQPAFGKVKAQLRGVLAGKVQSLAARGDESGFA